MLWDELQKTLKPLIDQYERECASRLEGAEQRAGAAEIVLQTLRLDVARLQSRLEALSTAPSDADRAAEAALALYHIADTSEAPMVANYLRARGWTEQRPGWVAPGGGGPLPPHTAVRLQVSHDLVAVRQRVRHTLAEAARAPAVPAAVPGIAQE